MNKIKIILIALLLTSVSTASYSEEPVRCNDIRKYVEWIKFKAKSAKKIIGSKLTNIKEGTNKALATTFGEVEHCKRWISEGYRMMNVGTVLTIGTIQMIEIYSELRSEFSWYQRKAFLD